MKLIKALFRLKSYIEYIFFLRNSERHFLVRCHQSCFFFIKLILLSICNDKNTARGEMEFSASSHKLDIRVVEATQTGLCYHQPYRLFNFQIA